MTLTFRRVDPDDADAVARAAALITAADRVDAPQGPLGWPAESPEVYGAMLRHGWDGEPPRVWLAYAGEVLVGLGRLDEGEWDNVDLAWLGVVVHPDHRRHGHGSAILEHLVAEAVSNGRTMLGADGWEGEALAGFAARHGFEAKAVDAVRCQDLTDPGLAQRVARLAEEAARAATAYDLVRYAGPVPEADLPGIVALTTAINDAPTDDLEIEDEVFTPERVRGYERAMEPAHRMYRLVARHSSTGEPAGHSVVVVERGRPHLAMQHDTSVVPTHRGHRLGLLLKAEMLRWLADEEPDLRVLYTFNAASNAPMIAVNEVLGYVPIGRIVQHQRRAVSQGASGG